MTKVSTLIRNFVVHCSASSWYISSDVSLLRPHLDTFDQNNNKLIMPNIMVGTSSSIIKDSSGIHRGISVSQNLRSRRQFTMDVALSRTGSR